MCVRFTVLAVSDLIDDAAEGGHDVERGNDDPGGLGQFFNGLDRRLPHVLNDGLNGFSLPGRQLRFKKRISARTCRSLPT